ncbi:MAG: hypothetical protein ACJA07_001192 [Rhodococcus sp. (in: high G+C Gram-positive bacteria)]
MVVVESSSSESSEFDSVVVRSAEVVDRREDRVVDSVESLVVDSVTVVVARGVVGTATSHVGDGGTVIIEELVALTAVLRLLCNAGGRTFSLESSNAPPRAPIVNPVATASPAIATAEPAMTLSRM